MVRSKLDLDPPIKIHKMTSVATANMRPKKHECYGMPDFTKELPPQGKPADKQKN